MPNGIAALVQIKIINHKSEKYKSETVDSCNRSLSGKCDAASRPKDGT
jgi:hypothetical protein